MKTYISMIFITAIFTSSCSSTKVMQDNNYNLFSAISGGLQKCFEKEKITPKLYADTMSSLTHVLSTWRYDENKFSSMSAQAYSRATLKDCRQVEAYAYRLNSIATEDKQDKRENAKAAWDEYRKDRNKTTFCNKIGTMTICN